MCGQDYCHSVYTLLLLPGPFRCCHPCADRQEYTPFILSFSCSDSAAIACESQPSTYALRPQRREDFEKPAFLYPLCRGPGPQGSVASVMRHTFMSGTAPENSWKQSACRKEDLGPVRASQFLVFGPNLCA